MTKRGWRSFRVAAVACGMAVAAASAQTKAVEGKSGKPSPESRPRKILVLAVSPDSSTRVDFEDVIAGELALRGATAVASHVAFPELPKERGPFEEKLVADGFDAVTVSRLVGRDDKSEYKEGTTTYQPNYLGQDAWGGYWYTYQQVYLPDYLARETRVRVRTDFWRASDKGGRLVWSGTTDVLDPLTVAQAARELGVSIAKALVKAKLI
jgi:hypothetical protein